MPFPQSIQAWTKCLRNWKRGKSRSETGPKTARALHIFEMMMIFLYRIKSIIRLHLCVTFFSISSLEFSPMSPSYLLITGSTELFAWSLLGVRLQIMKNVKIIIIILIIIIIYSFHPVIEQMCHSTCSRCCYGNRLY